jgi:histidinol-phosphatase (PHP family)
MNILTDYHMHSIFSPDGHETPQTLCRRALGLGLQEIAITEHAEWHPALNWNGFAQVDDYFEAIAACRAEFEPQGLIVYSGVELGNPHQYPQQAAALLAAYSFDVVLASVHWLYDENIHLAGVFAGRHADEVYADYFTELGRMAAATDFEIVAHFDRLIWRGTELGYEFNPERLEPIIRDALSEIARAGRILELNTRFLRHQPGWNQALLTMLRWFRIAGGLGVVVNSDAHRATELGRHLTEAKQLLAAAGIEGSVRIKQYAAKRSQP